MVYKKVHANLITSSTSTFVNIIERIGDTREGNRAEQKQSEYGG